MENLRILILAAGKSTRMKSKYAKVLHRVGGRMLIEHVLRSARSISGDIWVVVGHTSDKVKASIPEVKFVDQGEQLGTGHAVMAARDQFAEYTGDLLVLSGDVPLIAPDTLKAFVDFHRKEGYRASVITADADDPTGYGRIVRRNESDVDAIVEQRDATPEILKIREINSGIYVFDAPALFKSLTKIRNDNAQREYYLPDVIGILVSQRESVGAFKVRSAAEILGINTRQELAVIDLLMRRRKCESLMAEGVTIIDPHSTIIDEDVRIGADSVIYPSVQIYGDTVIGDDVTIHSFSRISNSTLRCASAEMRTSLPGRPSRMMSLRKHSPLPAVVRPSKRVGQKTGKRNRTCAFQFINPLQQFHVSRVILRPCVGFSATSGHVILFRSSWEGFDRWSTAGTTLRESQSSKASNSGSAGVPANSKISRSCSRSSP